MSSLIFIIKKIHSGTSSSENVVNRDQKTRRHRTNTGSNYSVMYYSIEEQEYKVSSELIFCGGSERRFDSGLNQHSPLVTFMASLDKLKNIKMFKCIYFFILSYLSLGVRTLFYLGFLPPGSGSASAMRIRVQEISHSEDP